MKRIIFCLSVLFSFSIFPMDDRRLIIDNKSGERIIVVFKKPLPGRVQLKQEVILPHKSTKIPLPVTNTVRLKIAGYDDQKIYDLEYQTPLVIKSHEQTIVISQEKKTLAVAHMLPRQ